MRRRSGRDDKLLIWRQDTAERAGLTTRRYNVVQRADGLAVPTGAADRLKPILQFLTGAGTAMVELVFGYLPAERIAVNAKSLSGAGLVAVRAVEHSLDETFLELSDSFIEEDAALDHLQY